MRNFGNCGNQLSLLISKLRTSTTSRQRLQRSIPAPPERDLPGEVAVGPNAVADSYRELFTAFPDMRFTDIEPGSLLSSRRQGDLGDLACPVLISDPIAAFPPPAAQSIYAVAIFEFDGADLVCERAYFDRIGLLISLGVGRDPNARADRVMTLLNHPVTVARAALRSRGSI